jgi:hypothetical protein
MESYSGNTHIWGSIHAQENDLEKVQRRSVGLLSAIGKMDGPLGHFEGMIEVKCYDERRRDKLRELVSLCI